MVFWKIAKVNSISPEHQRSASYRKCLKETFQKLPETEETACPTCLRLHRPTRLNTVTTENRETRVTRAGGGWRTEEENMGWMGRWGAIAGVAVTQFPQWDRELLSPTLSLSALRTRNNNRDRGHVCVGVCACMCVCVCV